MYNVRNISDELLYIGCDDRRCCIFEGVYSVPAGMSYNSYLLNDEKKVIFDTADKAVTERYIENTVHALGGAKPDYIIVTHAEPDHTASLSALLRLYPDTEVICSAKAAAIIDQLYGSGIRFRTVSENDVISTGRHSLRFISAPMVHWPEVMVVYDETDKTLFSADAFGSFGALGGGIFADETDFERNILPEARRYYCNIVGKYGIQVQGLLKKASALEIKTICPLHGHIWRRNRDIELITEKYSRWSSYEPEDREVLIAYASVYGNTENAAEILSRMLFEKGVKTVMMDVSMYANDVIVSEAFRCAGLVFAAPTYNGGIFVRMEEVLRELAAHGVRKRACALIENGSWASVSAKQMGDILSSCKEMDIRGTVTLKSAMTEEQLTELEGLADDIAAALCR